MSARVCRHLLLRRSCGQLGDTDLNGAAGCREPGNLPAHGVCKRDALVGVGQLDHGCPHHAARQFVELCGRIQEIGASGACSAQARLIVFLELLERRVQLGGLLLLVLGQGGSQSVQIRVGPNRINGGETLGLIGGIVQLGQEVRQLPALRIDIDARLEGGLLSVLDAGGVCHHLENRLAGAL